MGLGSFMQNFAIGALGQLNEGFAEQHRQQAYQDAQDANMVREVSMNAINRYNTAYEKAAADAEQHQRLVAVWGETYAAALEGGASVSDLQHLNQTGNVPANTYYDTMNSRMNDLYQGTLKTVQSNPTNRKIKGRMDWGQIFQPPKPIGPSGFKGMTPIQQAQVSQLHGPSQGDTITPPGGPSPVQAAPIGATDAAQTSAQQIGPNFSLKPTVDNTPNNQNMLALNKAIAKSAADTVNVYFKQPNGSTAMAIQTSADGSTTYHFNDVNADQLVQNLQMFGHEISQKLIEQRAHDHHELRPQDINDADVSDAMMGATRMLIEDLRAHGYQEDVGVKVLGAMTPQEFSKAVWNARDDNAQRSQAKAQGVGLNQVGSYLDIKNHPNDPNVNFVQKHYDTVVALVQQYHSQAGGYPEEMNTDDTKDAAKFNQRYKGRLTDKAGKPTTFTPKLDKTSISKEQAQAMVNQLSLADYMKLAQRLDAQQNTQRLQQQNIPEKAEIGAEPNAQPGDSGDGLQMLPPGPVTPSKKDKNGNPIVNPAEEGQ